MGRPSSVSPEEIFAVADAIGAEGGDASNREVLARLGRGSMGTIARAMRDWHKAQARPAAVDVALTDSVQRAITMFVQSKVTAACATLEADLVEERRTVDDLIAENKRQVEEIASQGEMLMHAAAETAAAQGRATQLETEVERVKTDLAREREIAGAERTELAKALLRVVSIPRLEQELTAMNVELASERSNRVEFERQVAVLHAQLIDRESRLAEVREERDQCANDLREARKRIDSQARS